MAGTYRHDDGCLCYPKYRQAITRPRDMHAHRACFCVAAFVATGVAGAFGAFLNKYAPVRGGSVIILMEGGK